MKTDTQLLFAILLLFILFTHSHASVYRVPVDCSTVGEAVGAAAAGDTVVVAEGLYPENVMIKKGLILQGGWSSDFTVRDPERHASILDGLGREKSVIEFQGREGDSFLIEGFTVQNGWVDGNGGGLLIRGKATAVIRNNRFLNNYARYHGGGLCAFRASDCLVEGNYFEGNSAVFHGGGLCFLDGVRGEVAGNVFVRNLVVADSGGGVACLKRCAVTIRGNRFEKNKTIKRGAGLSFLQEIEGRVTDNLFVENDCGYIGGSVYSWKSSPVIERNTIVRNYSPVTGGIRIDNRGETFVGANLVVRCNGPWLFRDGESVIRSERNLVYATAPAEGIAESVGALGGNPLLCDEAGDYRLQQNSPCLGEEQVGCYSVTCGEEPPPGEPPLR